jgi:uncharacterized protein YbjT (DUF2867 family)
MHYLLLGASGGVGRWVTRLALERGHRLTAIVRSGTPYEAPPEVAVLRGDVLDPAVLDAALGTGLNAVLCCLGVRRINPKNPWSAVPPPHDLTQRVAAHLVAAMPRHGIRRVVAISSAGVGDSAAWTHWLLRWVFDHSNVRIAFDDLLAMEQTFARSDLDWIAVRPTRLVDGPPTGHIAITDRFGLRGQIPRGDVAAWMLDTIVQSASSIAERLPMVTGY